MKCDFYEEAADGAVRWEGKRFTYAYNVANLPTARRMIREGFERDGKARVAFLSLAPGGWTLPLACAGVPRSMVEAAP